MTRKQALSSAMVSRVMLQVLHEYAIARLRGRLRRPPPRMAGASFAAALVAAGLATVPFAGAQAADPVNEETLMVENSGEEARPGAQAGVAGLPFADPDRVFADLDDYLAHRAYVSTMGAPTLREISPGRYIEEFRGGKVNYYTREELLRKFGFSR